MGDPHTQLYAKGQTVCELAKKACPNVTYHEGN